MLFNQMLLNACVDIIKQQELIKKCNNIKSQLKMGAQDKK